MQQVQRGSNDVAGRRGGDSWRSLGQRCGTYATGEASLALPGWFPITAAYHSLTSDWPPGSPGEGRGGLGGPQLSGGADQGRVVATQGAFGRPCSDLTGGWSRARGIHTFGPFPSMHLPGGCHRVTVRGAEGSTPIGLPQHFRTASEAVMHFAAVPEYDVPALGVTAPGDVLARRVHRGILVWLIVLQD